MDKGSGSWTWGLDHGYDVQTMEMGGGGLDLHILSGRNKIKGHLIFKMAATSTFKMQILLCYIILKKNLQIVCIYHLLF